MNKNLLFFCPFFGILNHHWLVIRTDCDENDITVECLLTEQKFGCEGGYDVAVIGLSVVV